MQEAVGNGNAPEVRNPDGRTLSKADGGVWQVLSPPCAGELRCLKKASRRPNADSSHSPPSSLSTPRPPPPHTLCTNPPPCMLILHIIACCFRLVQQFMIFGCSNLRSRGPQLQVITLPLLGSSNPSTPSVGSDAYRQKAI